MKPRLLANENFPAPSVRYVRDAGYDLVSVGEGAGGLADQAVLAFAESEKRWIVTFDRDYGELIFARGLGAPPALILCRMRSYRPESPGRLVVELLESGNELEGYFIVLDESGSRKRPLPEAKSARD